MWSSESFQIHDFLSACTNKEQWGPAILATSHPSSEIIAGQEGEKACTAAYHHHPLNILLLSPSSPQTLSPAISPSRCTQCAITYTPPISLLVVFFVKSLLSSRWDCFACVQMETFEMCINSKIRKNTLKMQDKYLILLMAKIKWKISSWLDRILPFKSGMRWVVNDFTRGAIRRGAGGVVEYMRAPRCEEKPR